ncbi:hypothetical protein H2248_002986 [Termitomyces sp. 'cryptogamus']|nr:hypothetical protein H2248_002986 [Termitomyces sp. 'cryptogamus']
MRRAHVTTPAHPWHLVPMRTTKRLQTQIQVLQAQVAQRLFLQTVQQSEKEYRNLDLLLQGTQAENERCMAELDRCVPCSSNHCNNLRVFKGPKTREDD